MDLLPFPLTAFSVFLVIAGIGFGFLVISLVFGEIFDFFDGSLDHDFDHGGPGLLSTRAIAIFITTFGASGAIATHYGLSPLASSGIGAAIGLVFAAMVAAFARFLYGQQASSDVGVADLVGQPARVVVAIPAGGVGQIRCRLGDELIDKIARAHDDEMIPENVSVRVEQALGEIVVVRRH
jgi:membrane protein implicated in regulation of membrane protease activity